VLSVSVPSVDNSGEIKRMYNAIEDLYILYIEETLSISVVYTILSSRPQSFLSSFSALCTIPHSAACISPAILIYCFCISPFSPGQGWATEAKVGVGEAGGVGTSPPRLCQCGLAVASSTPIASEDSAELSPRLPVQLHAGPGDPATAWGPPVHPWCPGPRPGPGGTAGSPRRRWWDGAPGPGGTVEAGRQGLLAHGDVDSGSWLAMANRGDG